MSEYILKKYKKITEAMDKKKRNKDYLKASRIVSVYREGNKLKLYYYNDLMGIYYPDGTVSISEPRYSFSQTYYNYDIPNLKHIKINWGEKVYTYKIQNNSNGNQKIYVAPSVVKQAKVRFLNDIGYVSQDEFKRLINYIEQKEKENDYSLAVSYKITDKQEYNRLKRNAKELIIIAKTYEKLNGGTKVKMNDIEYRMRMKTNIPSDKLLNEEKIAWIQQGPEAIKNILKYNATQRKLSHIFIPYTTHTYISISAKEYKKIIGE